LSAKELVNSSPNIMTLGIPTPQTAHHSPLHTHCSLMHYHLMYFNTVSDDHLYCIPAEQEM